MADSLIITDSRNLSIVYNIDDKESGMVFIVESSKASGIIQGIVEILDVYRITSWSFNLGKEYKNLQTNCMTQSIISSYLIDNIKHTQSRSR